MATKPAIGIDLGTSYSSVAVYQNGKVEIIANEQNNRKTPSFVAFTDTERLVGDSAKDQLVMNPTNTIFGEYNSRIAKCVACPISFYYFLRMFCCFSCLFRKYLMKQIHKYYEDSNHVLIVHVGLTDCFIWEAENRTTSTFCKYTKSIFLSRSDVKRLIGRRFDDKVVQSHMAWWPFTVVNDGGRPKIQVDVQGEKKSFFPEEITAMILRKMKETAEAYLGTVNSFLSNPLFNKTFICLG